MGKNCFLLADICCLSSSSVGSVTLPAGGPAGRVGGRAADTARRASTVTSREGDTLLELYSCVCD